VEIEGNPGLTRNPRSGRNKCNLKSARNYLSPVRVKKLLADLRALFKCGWGSDGLQIIQQLIE
jgi:hypothetical protein